MATTEIFILTGALAGGYVTGLAGFGTGLAALAFWLHAVQPVVAAPLVVICSIIGQLQSLPDIWRAIVWRRILPFVLGGLFGVPLGTILLPLIPLNPFKLLIGGLLIIYSSFMLVQNSAPKISWGGPIADGIVGLGGGILGGLAGLSGPLPTVWASLKGWGRHEKRSIFQTFNLSVLLFAGISQAIGGFITAEVARLIIVALPGTIAGVWLGRKTYDKLGDHRFNQVILGLLLIAGISMIITSAF